MSPFHLLLQSSKNKKLKRYVTSNINSFKKMLDSVGKLKAVEPDLAKRSDLTKEEDDSTFEINYEQIESDEYDFEELLEPQQLWVLNLRPYTTKYDVRNLFKEAIEVTMFEEEAFKNTCLVHFSSVEETKNAFELQGELLNDYHVELSRTKVGRLNICTFSGFSKEDSEEDIREYVEERFEECATVIQILYPKDSETDSFLGFVYVYLSIQEGKVVDFKDLLKGSKDITVPNLRSDTVKALGVQR